MAEIKQIENLITPILGNNKKFIAMKTERLTAAGDNYGSMMWGVDIKIENQQRQTENVRAVAKMLPRNEFIQKAFNSQITFPNEVAFYKIIAPALRDFQKQHGLVELFDSFPAYYGARLSLDPESVKVDQDAVLLIKNIKDDGFVNVDRTVGFDLEQTKLILEKMAELHATFMAFKSQNPDFFDNELKQYFQEFKIFDFVDDTRDEVIKSLIGYIKDDEFCARHIDKIKNILDCNQSNVRNGKTQNDNFLSLAHTDLWCNNIMVKIVNDKTVDVKFVDFQLYEYSTLTRDVIFYLFTSVQLSILREHCDEFLNFYHQNLIQWLKKFNYDVTKLCFEAFIETIKQDVKERELFHVMVLLGAIYAKNEQNKEVEEMREDHLVEQREKSSEQCKEKARFIVQEFVKRKWL